MGVVCGLCGRGFSGCSHDYPLGVLHYGFWNVSVPKDLLIQQHSQDSRKKPAGPTKYCDNKVRNNKYTLLTFLPKTLYEEFRFFFNLYFLVVALSQFFPPLKVGLYLFSPHGFIVPSFCGSFCMFFAYLLASGALHIIPCHAA